MALLPQQRKLTEAGVLGGELIPAKGMEFGKDKKWGFSGRRDQVSKGFGGLGT